MSAHRRPLQTAPSLQPKIIDSVITNTTTVVASEITLDRFARCAAGSAMTSATKRRQEDEQAQEDGGSW